jgi:predicted PurR-regulated permease PerM
LVLVVLAAALGVYAAGPAILEQGRLLWSRLPGALHTLARGVEHPPSWLRPLIGSGGPAPQLHPEPEQVISGATGIATGLSVGLGTFVVIFFLGAYGALSPSSYTRPLVKLFPRHERDRASEVLGEIGETLGRWLFGRVLAMAFVGVFTWIGLAVLRVPLALGLGILAGLLTFIEYLGAVVSAVPAILLGLTVSPLHAAWVVLLFTAVHIIEGYVLTPLIARQAVHIPPAYTLAAQLVLGGLFGVMGLTFATPTCVVALILIQRTYLARLERAGETAPRRPATREEGREDEDIGRESMHHQADRP